MSHGIDNDPCHQKEKDVRTYDDEVVILGEAGDAESVCERDRGSSWVLYDGAM